MPLFILLCASNLFPVSWALFYVHLTCSSSLQRKLTLNDGSDLLKPTWAKDRIEIQVCL